MSYLLIGLLSSFLTLVTLTAALGFKRLWRKAMGSPGPATRTGSGPARIGGVAMVLALGITGLSAAALPIGSEHVPAPGILPALLGAFIVFLIGWIDDLHPLPPLLKLVGQVGAASLSYALGLRAGFIPVGPLNQAFTVFCLVGGANAVNLIDGMDGLAAGVSAIAATTLFFIARDLGEVNAAALAAGLAGCSLGFLWLNLPPARFFMGDSGSNLLGFGLAAVPLLLSGGPEGFGDFSVAILLLVVPIAETASSILRRVLVRRSPFQGDLDHVHHRLLRQGWSQGAVLGLFCGITLFVALLILFGRAIAMASDARTIGAWLAMGSLVTISSLYILSAPAGKTRGVERKPEI